MPFNICIPTILHVTDSNDSEYSIGAEVEELQLKMFSLLSEESSEFLLYAALLGDDSSITEYLQKFPNEVTN